MPEWGQLLFQDAASPIIKELIFFHDYALIILTLVITVVGYALFIVITNKFTARFIKEAQWIETIWTIIPRIILVCLALPSLRILYLTDELNEPSITLKAIGSQWYWRYEYSEFPRIHYDVYIKDQFLIKRMAPRLLQADNWILLPTKQNIRLLVTATDVIHAWTIPSLGVKADAVPGRLNQLSLYISRPGTYYGQCSEICGANHSYIPISIVAVRTKPFLKWTKKIVILGYIQRA